MKLELEFATGDDLVNFLASLTATGRKYVGLTEKTATAAAREINTPAPGPAAVTPDKQDAARASTKKADKPAPAPAPEPAAFPNASMNVLENPAPAPGPVDALAATLNYETDIVPVIAKAQARDKEATVKVLDDLGARSPEGKISGKFLAADKYAEAVKRLNVILEDLS